MADVCPSMSVPSAKISQSVSSKQFCKSEVASLVHIYLCGWSLCTEERFICWYQGQRQMA